MIFTGIKLLTNQEKYALALGKIVHTSWILILEKFIYYSEIN